jgi:hypothetical protein
MNKVLYLVLIGIILALLAPPVGAAMSQAQMDQRCE